MKGLVLVLCEGSMYADSAVAFFPWGVCSIMGGSSVGLGGSVSLGSDDGDELG